MSATEENVTIDINDNPPVEMKTESVKVEECIELKNIKYKTMLISGTVLNNPIKTSVDDLSNLDKFLEDNKTSSRKEPWSKLDKTIKTEKMMVFAEKYSAEKKHTKGESIALLKFLKDCLGRRRLQRVKDIDYDKELGEIINIPSLTFIKTTKHFTLKNTDKRVSTLKSLLIPKHKATIKNKNQTDDDVTEDTPTLNDN